MPCGFGFDLAPPLISRLIPPAAAIERGKWQRQNTAVVVAARLQAFRIASQGST